VLARGFPIAPKGNLIRETVRKSGILCREPPSPGGDPDMSSDPVSTMSNEHGHARELARRLEDATERGDAAAANALAKELTDALNAHAALEEEILYPALVKVAPDLAPKVEEVLAAHAAAKSLLYEAHVAGESLDAKRQVLDSAPHAPEGDETGAEATAKRKVRKNLDLGLEAAQVEVRVR
jgi:iron-sulfur cluster repair protein YtfE (RIC family)